MDTNSKELSGNVRQLKQFFSIILWLGGSAGSIGVLLTAFGFLVEHAYLEGLKVPRTVFEATATEYIVSGGKFLVGLLPHALIGLLQFVLNCWWAVIPLVIYAGLFAFKKWTLGVRLSVFTGLYAIWLAVILLHFEKGGKPTSLFDLPPDGSVAIFTFTTIAGVMYFCWEVRNVRRKWNRATNFNGILRSYKLQLPLFLLLVCAILALPYLRGRYGTKRMYPTIEFLGSERGYFDELVSDSLSTDIESASGRAWQIIEIGEEKAILRLKESKQVYVVPKDKITSFRIVKVE